MPPAQRRIAVAQRDPLEDEVAVRPQLHREVSTAAVHRQVLHGQVTRRVEQAVAEGAGADDDAGAVALRLARPRRAR